MTGMGSWSYLRPASCCDAIFSLSVRQVREQALLPYLGQTSMRKKADPETISGPASRSRTQMRRPTSRSADLPIRN